MYLLQRVCFAASCLIACSPSIAIGSNYVLMYKYAPQVMCALLLPLPPSWSIFLCANGGDHQEEPVFILCVKTALPMVLLANIFPNRSSCYGARGASWWCLHFTCIYRPQRKVIDIGQFNSVAPRHCTHTHTHMCGAENEAALTLISKCWLRHTRRKGAKRLNTFLYLFKLSLVQFM